MQRVWETNKNKHNETCSTLQRGAWAYKENIDGKNNHLNADQVFELLQDANDKRGMKLLLNTGPLPDRSIHPEDVKSLDEVKHLIEQQKSK